MYRVGRAASRQPSPRTGARIGEMVHERSSRWRTPDIRWHVCHVCDAAVRRAQFEHIRLLEQTVWSTCRQRWEQAGVQRLRTGKATTLLAKAALLLTSLRSDLVTYRRLSMGPLRLIRQANQGSHRASSLAKRQRSSSTKRKRTALSSRLALLIRG